MNILKAMFFDNTWLWFHILGGGIIIKACLIWVTSEPQLALTFTLVIAVCWEIIEYSVANVKEEYGSKKRYFADALGDIIGAMAAAIVVVL